jgi:hypothetical protein
MPKTEFALKKSGGGTPMGLCISLQSEFGEPIESIADDKNLLNRLLDFPDAKTFPMLASIDRYGDTTFNRVQIHWFLAEWETLFDKAATSEERTLLQSVRNLGQKVRNSVHVYLVFIGG